MKRFGCAFAMMLIVIAVGFFLVRTPEGAPGPSAQPAAPAIGGSTPLVIPVAKVTRAQLIDTWGQSRADGAREHHAIDIVAPRGTPVIAAAAGVVEKIFDSKAGGHTVYVRLPDGMIHYYAHLDSYADGLRQGQAVAQGQRIATVGSTGNAIASAPHLHFEIKRMAPGDAWWEGTEVNPYPLLAGGAP